MSSSLRDESQYNFKRKGHATWTHTNTVPQKQNTRKSPSMSALPIISGTGTPTAQVPCTHQHPANIRAAGQVSNSKQRNCMSKKQNRQQVLYY